MNVRKHILVVDDDGAVRDLIAAFLTNAGYRVSTAADGFATQTSLARGDVDLVLLDLNLPDCDGVELARTLRRASRVGIIMVTERDAPDQRATGLELGADDYVTKPFFPRELLARVRNVLDRATGGHPTAASFASHSEAAVVLPGGWVVDRVNRLVIGSDGRDAHLTGAEFDLLSVFLDHPGQLLSRERLLDLMRAGRGTAPGDDGGEDEVTGGRAIDVLVSRLRRKLGDERGRDAGGSRLIDTLRGHGYRFNGPV